MLHQGCKVVRLAGLRAWFRGLSVSADGGAGGSNGHVTRTASFGEQTSYADKRHTDTFLAISVNMWQIP
jgi:hypothetical protein